MNPEDLLDYIENIIKPALEDYARSRNINLDELLLESITLENTGFFNYKGKQSTVYNRLRNNNITNLKELFMAYDNNSIDYGKNELKNNYNYYIHNEIDGIIALLRFKFLCKDSSRLRKLLDYKIHMNYNIKIDNVHVEYGYPGDVCYSVYGNKFIKSELIDAVDEIYKVLKSCGFDQIGVKALIDIMYEKRINDVSLGDFLSSLSVDEVCEKFKRVPQEFKPFLNILNTIVDFHKYYNKEENKKRY